MGSVFVDIMPPSNWQDFERLTLDWAKKQWMDDYAERNGRQGQEQAGVDVFGFNRKHQEYTGVQCKKRVWKTKPGADAPSNTLTILEVDKEIAAAKSFSPALDRFIIATTAPRDSDLQEHVRLHNSKGESLQVALMFWDDYVDFLNNHPEMMYRYYDNVLKYRSLYKSDEHYYMLLFMAFDRPAIRTPFHLENRAVDFIVALQATQFAIATGCLKDNMGRIVDQVRVPVTKPREIGRAAKKLQEARDIATKALSEGVIVEHEAVIEVRDPDVVDKINAIRFESVRLLNIVLLSNGIPLIVVD